jgi:hypothetical protein
MYIHSSQKVHILQEEESWLVNSFLLCMWVSPAERRELAEKKERKTGRSRESQKLPKNSGRPLSILVKKYKNFFSFYSLILF